MKVVIEFRRNVDECTEMEIDVTEQEVDDYFREAGDDWVLRQPLQQRLDVFAWDN